ncbi:SDR family NAD(P)-dependent oxidoreductase [Flavobacterium sp. GT3P67]|uniref:SDR family NAD(P)-dependent oxidoreductase n=1 Tax=Flavobacterium sp. GT3P67 TaxID=2541722 RepID=UPI00104C07F1|nr:SDR family NAD(P)-dependent oxidoreductase [Flavobacterium sp. GT3P67]TDE51285.1 SDR family oxidoreductase [Flavobacterium sp. GT3P67]
MIVENKIVLITGASKGIGKAIAELFAKEGARLVLTGRDVDGLNKLKNSLPIHAEEHLTYEMDVTKIASIKKVFDSLNSQKIFIDCLVNNAGIMKDATLQMIKPEIIEEIYSTNVYGTILPSQFALKPLIRKRGGSIINVSSIIGTNGNLGQSIYGSSKAAIIGLTKSLSKELSGLNIRVNAIAPGFIDTDMTKGMDEKFYEKNLKSIGMRRLGQPEDVAKVALFLASDLSSYVTGQIIGVDGGMII